MAFPQISPPARASRPACPPSGNTPIGLGRLYKVARNRARLRTGCAPCAGCPRVICRYSGEEVHLLPGEDGPAFASPEPTFVICPSSYSFRVAGTGRLVSWPNLEPANSLRRRGFSGGRASGWGPALRPLPRRRLAAAAVVVERRPVVQPAARLADVAGDWPNRNPSQTRSTSEDSSSSSSSSSSPSSKASSSTGSSSSSSCRTACSSSSSKKIAAPSSPSP